MTILFESGFESGDFSDFDGVAASGLVEYRVQGRIAHGGNKAAKLTVYPAWGFPRPGVRLTWMNKKQSDPTSPDNLPRSALYSAWYFLPKPVTTSSINIMQWKQGMKAGGPTDPAWNVQVKTIDNQLKFVLRDRVDDMGQYNKGGVTASVFETNVPIAQWFELKTLYEWDREPKGRIASWLNGQLMWDIQGTRTEFDRPFVPFPRRVTWNNYAGDVKPWPYSLLVDDVRVET